MFKPLSKLLSRRIDAEVKREALIDAINRASRLGCCIILSGTAEGTRVTIFGKNTVQSQLEQIARDKGVIL